jgi:hypothetical protein
MIDTDYIHPPRGVERRAKLGAGHSESNNTDYINIILILYIYIIYLYRYYC